MSRNIPFFDMFAELQLSSELRLKLLGAVLTGATIDQSAMSITLQLTVKNPLPEEEIQNLQACIKAVYGFVKVEINVTCQAPDPMKSSSSGAAPAGGKSASKPSGKIIMGNPIKARPIPMKELDLKMGNAVVSGKVFAFECRETRRPGMWRLSFDMTDYTNSVTVQKNLPAKEAQALEGAIKPGMWLIVKGKMEPTWDGKDIQLNPYDINVTEHEERK